MKKNMMIDERLSCALTIPDGDLEKIPMILFLHGFGTNKDEVGDTFLIASEKLSEQGVGSLRIDFGGFGDSKGETADTTVDQLIIDAELALNFLLKQPFTDLQRIGICGFSLGAGISVLLTEKRNDEIKSMVLLSPAGNLPEDFSAYFGFAQYSNLETSADALELDLGWRQIKLKNKFIQSLKKHFLIDAIRHYKGTLFIVAGSDDFSHQHAYKYIEKTLSVNKRALILENNDHVFNFSDEATSSIDRVTTEIATWFKQML